MFKEQINVLRGKRRKVANNVVKEIADLTSAFDSHVRLSGDRFQRVVANIAKYEDYEDAIRGLKTAAKLV